MDLQQLMRGMQMGGMGAPAADPPSLDTAEQVYISSLPLLKMLKHGRAGVPFEVMGLMLGEIVDDYTVTVCDVFAMPQSGTGVSVEAVDPVFQQEMMDRLKQVGRTEIVVGWYHSHPGFGCWLSNVDVNTSQSFEQLNPRSVAVVVDPVQSVKGKVEIDAFRCIPQQVMLAGLEPRQTTSNIGQLRKPSIQALVHNLNRSYYSMPINYRKNELEIQMLSNLHKKQWTNGLKLEDFRAQTERNQKTVESMARMAKAYHELIKEENELDAEKFALANVGKINAKKRLEKDVEELMTSNIVQALGAMLDTVMF